ncbi:MAG: hypothetical protein ACHQ50_01410 [Fimbriimonadales bacterium]
MAVVGMIALITALASQAMAQDKSGVVGWEVLTTGTPGGGGELRSTGLNGKKTDYPLAVQAPTTAGSAVINITIQYFDSKESRDVEKRRREEAEKKREEDKKEKSSAGPQPEPPNVPTFDPRFFELIDGKVVPKKHGVQDSVKPEPKKPDVLWGPVRPGDGNTKSGPKKPDILWDPVRPGVGNTKSGPKKPDILWDPVRPGVGNTKSGPKKPDILWDPVRPGVGNTKSGPKKPDILWDPVRPGVGNTKSGQKKPDILWDPVRKPVPPIHDRPLAQDPKRVDNPNDKKGNGTAGPPKSKQRP